MIATVVFFAEECMLEGVLVSDVQATAMRKRAREVLVGTEAWFEGVEFVGGKRGSLQERAEEAGLFGGIQDGC